MFVITGKSCSGKNAVAAELEKRGYHRCVTYTNTTNASPEKLMANHIIS